MKTFGERINALRREAKLTLREVAEFLGTTVSYLSDVEHGRKRPFNQHVIAKLAEILDVNAEPLQKLAAKEKDMIEIPLSNQRVGSLAFALARSDDSVFEDDEIKQSIDDLMEKLNKRKK